MDSTDNLNNTEEMEISKIEIGEITELTYSGAELRLFDEKNAFLPWNEIWPTFKIHDSYTSYKIEEILEDGQKLIRNQLDVPDKVVGLAREIRKGDLIKVIACDTEFGKKKRTIYSHIRVFRNPWDEVADWVDGTPKLFNIESVTGSWANGIIEPGIRAQISIENFSSLLPKERWNGHQMPLPGDEIVGLFFKENVDYDKKIARLDFITYFNSNISVKDILFDSQHTNISDYFSPDKPIPEESLSSIASHLRIRKIFLLDDDEYLRESLTSYLTNECKIQVIECDHYEKAIEIIQENLADINLAIIDVHLLGYEKDFNGISTAKFIRHLSSKCPIVLITGDELRIEYPKVSESLDLIVQDIIYKPIGLDSIFSIFNKSSGPGKPLQEFLEGKSITVSSDTYISDIEESLEDLRSSLNAEAAVLFRINPITDEVQIRALSGSQDKYHVIGKEKLGWSPIRDAAINGETIFTTRADIPYIHPKHRYLQKAYKYQSCVGVPVIMDIGDYYAYSLFVFHPVQRRFKKGLAIRYAIHTAREISQLLKLAKLEEQIREMKPFEMMGQSYGSMAHDLTSALSSEMGLLDIKKMLGEGNIADALEKLEAAIEKARNAGQIVDAFRSMARGQHEKESTFFAKPEIEKIINSLKADVKNYNAGIQSNINIESSLQITMRLSNLRQLLINLVMNAAQQFNRLSGLNLTRKGEIIVSAGQTEDNDGINWLALQIHDNGPGIHKKDFERVFDIHYTTKENGCGMGLDICRKIAFDVGKGPLHGTVTVKKSLLLCGTTFEVKLPIINLINK